MYFDTHAHYDDERFDADRDEVLGSMESSGISYILNASSNLHSAKVTLDMADKYSFVYAAIGVHPHDSKEMTGASILEIEKLLQRPKAKAVGEIGLDYHYDFSPRDVQRKWFREQLELARSVNMPVVVHEREALRDVLDTIREYSDLTGVLHCFSGSWETAKAILDIGWFLSFTGVITFKNARKALEVVEKMPADRIMIETDCPYLAPEPVRGRRNSSLYLPYISERIAQVRGISNDDAAILTMENGKRFFGVD